MVGKGVECVTLLKMNSSIGNKIEHKIENILKTHVVRTERCSDSRL